MNFEQVRNVMKNYVLEYFNEFGQELRYVQDNIGHSVNIIPWQLPLFDFTSDIAFPLVQNFH